MKFSLQYKNVTFPKNNMQTISYHREQNENDFENHEAICKERHSVNVKPTFFDK